MLQKRFLLVLSSLLGLSFAQTVTITYWQYEFKSKVEAVDELIRRFEAQNPGIRVVQQTFPYDAYQQKVAAAIPAGQGPDVVNLYYGWAPTWVKAGYLVPLPEEWSARVDREFVSMVQAVKIGEKVYGVPTAVRSLALFYNKDLFRQAGLSGPPRSWDEFLAAAKKLTVKQGGRFTQIGYGIAPDGQDHHLVREILVRQFGGRPYSEDGRKVLYLSEPGLKAFTFYTDWVRKHEIGVPNFFPGNNGYRDGFMAGRIGMIIDGSFAIGTIQQGARFSWGVAELPVERAGGRKANFGSFWMHGLTPLATGPKREAALKFLAFLTSEETQRYWLEKVGELPASKALIRDPKLSLDPIYGPFILSLGYAKATPFVDETAQRKVMVDAINRVILQGMDPAQSLRMAAEEEQKILDRFWR
ncbi:carbohydrate ABC transporter substrate-binding protein, CUT1 family (TC 3.A.1.1.-) [Thermus arciformis]|uniref:Carbohydrate ABC transporter substrate-binding protein, CUT1 family (TC 3.A.1.1.-) n=1 Tax=Thermus arciformis TaxID=482827 RepID=A0A1G7ICZ0_9DEIN|nr:extracellular solute-binding protein [Thermus arciformis]SDF10376.1 carbohydrate ABC transporter substrate-binding protein, CUT1 family (TC 3.A.1.1.-) [Thermus arciformis]